MVKASIRRACWVEGDLRARDSTWTKHVPGKGKRGLKDGEATSGMSSEKDTPGPGLCVGTFLQEVMPLYKIDRWPRESTFRFRLSHSIPG